MAKLDRTKENPWRLKTPPRTSEYTMHAEEPRHAACGRHQDGCDSNRGENNEHAS